jgi:cystathionine beta-lyase/cystathionine gamma-synthase
MTWLPDNPPPPPDVMSVDDAFAWQERFVAAVTRHFNGDRGLLDGGDLGMRVDLGRPLATARCEALIAEVFGGEDAVLVRGAGSGAVRLACFAAIAPGSRVLVHDPATYLTTRLTLEAMGVEIVTCDFNSQEAVAEALERVRPAAVVVQHMRPRIDDTYDLAELIALVKTRPEAPPVVVDDNYAPLKAHRLGAEVGADLSAFSGFKMGGPVGVGCVVGRRDMVDRVRPFMNSGGSVVQGPESIELIEALARLAPVVAYQSAVTRQIAARLDSGEVPGVVRAMAAHSPETVVMVELEQPVAEAVRQAATSFGAVDRPVGMESRHEVVPAFLRPSKSLMADRPGVEEYVLRLSAMRAGADLVIDILRRSLEAAAR